MTRVELLPGPTGTVRSPHVLQIVLGSDDLPFTKHDDADERLWDLPDARRRTATLRGGTIFVELVEYATHAIGPVALHMKTLSVLHKLERPFGFSPEPAKWWHPPASASPAAA